MSFDDGIGETKIEMVIHFSVRCYGTKRIWSQIFFCFICWQIFIFLDKWLWLRFALALIIHIKIHSLFVVFYFILFFNCLIAYLVYFSNISHNLIYVRENYLFHFYSQKNQISTQYSITFTQIHLLFIF